MSLDTSKETNPNKKTIVAPPGDSPMSLEQLLKLFEIDLKIWKVDKFQPNSWPIGIKVEEKDIRFTDGVMNGHVKSKGDINTKRLYQAKAWLSRIELIPSKIPIQHISVSVKKSRKRPKDVKKVKTALFLPDPQFGFLKAINKSGAVPIHDRTAIDGIYQVALELKPDVIIWIGDVLDLSEWSYHFVNRPEFRMTTQAALIEAAWTIGYFKAAFPNSEHVVMIGNHDDRMEQYMIRNMSQAYMIKPADQLDISAIMAVDNLLGLERMGVKYVGNYPDGEWWLNEFLKAIHGNVARNKPGATASSIIDGAVVNQVFGHIHRQEIVSQRIKTMSYDRPIWAATPGCLCHIDGRVPGSTKDRNWQKGAGVVQYTNDGYVGFPELITVFEDTAIFRGSMFKGQDRFDELISATKGPFDWKSYETLSFDL